MKILLFAATLLLLSACESHDRPNYAVRGGGWQDLCSMVGGNFNNAPQGKCSM